MKVLSLFDGLSCGQIALNRIGAKPDAYYASELDKYAIKVTQANYPDTVQLGDVTKWREWDIDWASIDLLIGGSPCQGFSFAGKQLAFDDPRSKLFFVYVDILNHIRSVNPNIKFMLENVKMKKEYLDVISDQLGVEPCLINSALLSAQNRQRYYWCNWNVEQPEDRGIVLADILESDKKDTVVSSLPPGRYPIKTVTFNDRIKGVTEDERGIRYNKGDKAKSGISELGRILKPTAEYSDALTTSHMPKLALNSDITKLAYRKLTPIECERLQTVLQYIKPVEIVLCLDQAKSFASAVERNPKLLKLVLNAESEGLKEYAKLASQSMSANQASIRNTAPQNAGTQIQMQTEKCTSTSQGELNLIVGSAGNTTTYRQAERGVSSTSATQSAFINITEGKITHCGKEESPLTEQSYTEQMSGKIALSLCGGETVANAKDALSALEIMQTNQYSTSITSFRLSTKNLEQILATSYWFAKSAIDGFIQDTTKTKILYLNLVDGYTNHVSNTQRYKMLGNGFTVEVIAHIFKQMR